MEINIRYARPSDIPSLVELGRRMHGESPRFARLAFDPERLAGVAANLIPNKDACVLVGDAGGVIIGLFVGFVLQHFFSTALYATDLALYVRPEDRGGSLAVRFLRRFESWATGLGAAECVPGISTEVEVERTARLYERLGYKRSGLIMRRSL